MNSNLFDCPAMWLGHVFARVSSAVAALVRRFRPASGVLVLAAVLAACASPAAVAAPGTPKAAGLRTFPVEAVDVQIGVGSPVPVDVVVSGTWPDRCAQLAETRQTIAGGRIEITLLATPADPSCPPDYVGLAYRFAVPVNVAQLMAGSYSVVVNGVSADFDWQPGSTPPTVPVFDAAHVDMVTVDVEGSRAVKSVRAIISGSLANVCAQIREINLHREGSSFWIVVLADSPTEASCVEGQIPFELAIPLSVVSQPAGVYEVNVNGVTAEFDTTAN